MQSWPSKTSPRLAQAGFLESARPRAAAQVPAGVGGGGVAQEHGATSEAEWPPSVSRASLGRLGHPGLEIGEPERRGAAAVLPGLGQASSTVAGSSPSSTRRPPGASPSFTWASACLALNSRAACPPTRSAAAA